MSDHARRNVGVGTSPDGRVALAIDGTGHIIDPGDATWIADRIDEITRPEQHDTEDFGLLIRKTPELGPEIEVTLRDAGIESTADVRDASLAELTSIQTVGKIRAGALKEAAHRRDRGGEDS